MITTVNTLDFSTKATFINDLSPVENMVSFIIGENKQNSNLLNEKLRNSIIEKYNLIERTSKNNDKICICDELGFFARQHKN